MWSTVSAIVWVWLTQKTLILQSTQLWGHRQHLSSNPGFSSFRACVSEQVTATLEPGSAHWTMETQPGLIAKMHWGRGTLRW